MVVLTSSLYAWFGPPATVFVLLMNLVYCFFAPAIVENYYLHRGWVKVGGVADTPHGSQNAATRTCPFCAEDIKIEALKCKHCGSMLEPLPTPVEPSEQELMERYNIVQDGEKYIFRQFSYDKLSDAINYARQLESREAR